MRSAVIGIEKRTISNSDGVSIIPNGRRDIASLFLFSHEDRNKSASVTQDEKVTITFIARIFPV
jgi:hypothetical protein